MKIKAFRYACAVVLALTLALVPMGIVSVARGGDAYGVLDFVPTDDGCGYWLDADGNVVDDSSAYPYDGKLRASASADLPSAYDSRDIGVITPVKNQYSSGNCWTFSAMGALEASAVKKGILSLTDADFSEAHFVWFAYNPVAADADDPSGKDGHNLGSDCYETGANWMDTQSALARGSGAAAEADYPFSWDLSDLGDYDESARYDHSKATIANIDKIDSFMGELPSTLNAEVKQAIMENGAVQIAFYVDQANGFNGSSYFKSDASGTNHEVLIVGWDDDYDRNNFRADDLPDNNGAWLCKNSWGTGWGDGGYFWISYEEPTLCNFMVYEAAAGDDYSAIYQYDGNGCYGTAFSENSELFGANVFTAGDDEFVSKIGFYARGGNMNCTVRVYTGLTGDTPDTGVLAAEETFTEKYVGYKTYDLDTVVQVSEGEKFAVAIRTEYDGSYFVPVEGRINTVNGLEFVSEEKQSYVYKDGVWVDQATDPEGTHNVCVKALNVASSSHEHRYEDYVVTEPTCTEEGSLETKCTLCGDSLGVSAIDPLGHTASDEWVRTAEPTCTEAGEEVNKCAVCGEVLDTREVAATGHTPGAGMVVISSPTCVATGEKVRRCTVCGEAVESETTPISPNAHTYSSWTVISEGDCVTKGQKSRTCTLCGYEDVKDTTYGDHVDADGDEVCDICEEDLSTPEESEGVIKDGGGFGLDNFLARLKAFIERIVEAFKKAFTK